MNSKFYSPDKLRTALLIAASQGRFILFNPAGCWETIRADSRPISQIYKEFLVPIAALSALCGLLGNLQSGSAPFFASLLRYVASFSLGLAMIFLVAQLVCRIAPRFQGTSDPDLTFRWLAFSSTAAYLGGFFLIIPKAAPLALFLAAYGVAIAWFGITPMLKVGKDVRLKFALVSSLVVLLAFGAILLLLWALGAH